MGNPGRAETRPVAGDLERPRTATGASQRERELESLLANTPDILARLDRDLRCLYVNPAIERLFGLPAAAFLGKTADELGLSPAETAPWKEACREALRTGREQRRESTLTLPDGPRHLESRIVPELSPEGEVASLLSITSDITARKLAEQALRDSQHFLEQAQEVGRIGCWVSGLGRPDWSLTWSSAAYELFGVAPGTAIDVDTFFGVVHPDDREAIRAAVASAAAEHRPYTIEHRVVLPDGSIRWVLERADFVRDERGEPLRMVGVAQDVTERRAHEAALQASERSWRDLADALPLLAWTADAQGRVDYVNRRTLEYSGLTREALREDPGLTLHPEERAAAMAAWQRAVAGGEPFEQEVRLRGADGQHRWHLARAVPVRDPAGRVVRWYGSTVDIHDQRHLLEEQQKFVALIEHSGDFVGIAALDGRPLYLNRAGRALVGMTPDEDPSRRRFQELQTPEQRARMEREVLPAVLRDGRWEGESQLRHLTSGAVIDVSMTMFLVRRREDGAPLCIATVQRDLTERKRLEAQLRQAQKMEAVGRLAGGIAHDFNNLLTVITGYGDLLLARLPRGDPLAEWVEEIRLAGRRAAALTQQLLAFSRKQVLQPRVFDLNAVVRGLESMLVRLVGEDVQLVTTLGADLGHLRADPGQIEQVIVNLVVNARDALAAGGRITIETRSAAAPRGVGSDPPAPAPGWVLLAVSDTGSGMTQETLAHLFEPFFTTKEPGKGTGLGLSTVYGIVRQSGGHVWVQSQPGAGSTFEVYLPVALEPLHKRTTPGPLQRAARGTETVLVVEDEPTVRALTVAVLTGQGYQVLQAAGGEEALPLLRDPARPLDLLLTDLVMPGMSGRELAERALAARPGLRVLYTSGHTEDAPIRLGELQPGAAFLHKPYTPAGLLRALRELLDAPRE